MFQNNGGRKETLSEKEDGREFFNGYKKKKYAQKKILRWVKTIATWKTVIESMQSLGMDNFRVAFTRFLAFYSANPSRLRHGETLAKWPNKASFAPHPEDGGTFTVRHDFVGFVEPRESGIRNPEFVTLSYVTCWRQSKLNSHYNNYFIFNLTGY